MKKIIIFILFIFQNTYSVEIQEVIEGVYTGHGKAMSGEDVYYAMEKIDEGNITPWRRYVRQADWVTRENRGLIYCFALKCHPSDRIPYEQIAEYSGFSKEEYEHYLDTLYENGFSENKKYKTVGIGAGAAGFCIDNDGYHYVAYACKKPVKDKFKFPENIGEGITLKNFNTFYDDILISVKSDVRDCNDLTYHNRGIFRNPKVIVDGGYQGLSLKLHAFTAAVVKKYFPEKQYMRVGAIPSMYRIIKDKMGHLMPPQAYLGNAALPKELQHLRLYGGILDETCLVHVDALETFCDDNEE